MKKMDEKALPSHPFSACRRPNVQAMMVDIPRRVDKTLVAANRRIKDDKEERSPTTIGSAEMSHNLETCQLEETRGARCSK